MVPTHWWARFSQYEVVEGVICPASGATLTDYSPWQAFETGRMRHRRRKRLERPYADLVKLVEGVAYSTGVDGTAQLTAETEARILAWCSQHGLLGVLPHLLLEYVGPPYWDREEVGVEDEPDEDGNWIPRYSWVAVQSVVVRWSYGFGELRDRLPITSDGPQRYRAAVDEELVANAGARVRPPHVITVTDYFDPLLKQEPTSGLRGFFPRVAVEGSATYVCPPPGSQDFWMAYGEPVIEFLRAAKALAKALHALEPPRRDPTGLNRLAAGMGISLAGQRMRPRLTWSGPSLLCALAHMAMQDVAGGSVVPPNGCQACGRFFMAQSFQSKYCSEQCRRRIVKRRYRHRLRATRRRSRDARRTQGRT